MEKITPEDYRKILTGIDLKNILLSDLKASIKHELLTDGLKIGIKEDAQYSYEDEELIIKSKYALTAKNNDKKIVIKIESVFIVVFESTSSINDEFFEIYKEISLPLNVWPFFRELVNSITSRMNIPPLTLPLLKR